MLGIQGRSHASLSDGRPVGARSPRTVSVTYRDGSPGPGLGCRGTTRGTSTGRIPVQCVLSVRPRVASVQVEPSWRPSGPLLIRGFRVRAPGAPPLTSGFVGPNDHWVEWVAVWVAVRFTTHPTAPSRSARQRPS